MNLDVQNKNTYKSNIQKIKDLFKVIVPTASVSVGSVLYELIIRPISVLVTSIAEAFETSTYLESLSYLSTSTNSTPGRADYVLSNYFVTRMGGSDATGLITIYSTDPQTRIGIGTTFNISGTTIQATKTTIAIHNKPEDYESTEDIAYIDAYSVGNLYCFNIQVTTGEPSNRIIPEGTPVEPVSNITGFDSAITASAISGGSTGETDAEMVARARYMMCSWQGCSNSINKLLNMSGITVYSSMSFDGSDPEMSRVVNSPVYIGTAGMIDTYVKTSKYPMSESVKINISPEPGSSVVDITDSLPHKGIISVDSVIVLDGPSAGEELLYDVEWGSSDNNITSEGARFSVYQTVAIKPYEDINYSEIIVKYTYMPYIQELQDYMDRADVRMLGTSIIVKAAIPAHVRVTADSVKGSWDSADIIEEIKQYINGLPTGTLTINTADIQEYISNNLPGAYLKNPVHLQTVTHSYDGPKSHMSSSVSGVIESPATSDTMSGRVRFFCISDEEASIE